MQYQLKSKQRTDPASQKLSGELARSLSLEPEVADILVSRGIDSIEAARRFLEPSQMDLIDPFLFRDMNKAVNILTNAIRDGKKILIHGDYDADGVTASAIMFKALKSLGAQVTVFLPSRSEHGYGIAMETIEQYKDHAVLLTVDCGITNVAQVQRARELGMQTIITDHHTCPAELPEADCILNPKISAETYPFKELCGAGIAFKTAQALLGEDALSLLDLAAVGTIADVMPLIGENRAIAALGIYRFNTSPNLGLRILHEMLKGPESPLDAQSISFSLAPCINAAGRLSSAKLAYDLLVATNPEIARMLAKSLTELNEKRRARQEEIARDIDTRLQKLEKLPSIIVLYDESWENGLVGIAAGRVAEKTGRPTILLGKSGSHYVGSGRSVPNFNLYKAILSVEHLLLKFGGHSAAAGLTIDEAELPEMIEGLEEYARSVDLRPQEIIKEYDLEVHLPLRPKFIQSLAVLEPCGEGNPRPEFLLRNTHLQNLRSISDGIHTAFSLTTRAGTLDAVAFRTPASALPATADVVGNIEISAYTHLPQMIVSLFSFRDPAEEPFLKAILYVLRATSPRDARRFFSDKKRLGKIYSAAKVLLDKSGPMSCAQLYAGLGRFIPDLTIHQYAFALSVFGDLKLLEGIRDAKIRLTLPVQKQHLEDSGIFRIFEEHIDGSQGKD